ncbi:MAG: O-acetyl-ADP-ribose deacetylase [Acidobacteria bacterium]|nr:MAG: O-acetyl-ADP-ribose deacetylase [Acidobacteriota bacterium]
MIRQTFLHGRVVVLVSDITQQNVDAIVNAANSSLMGGGGVDGAIHRAGGPAILKECREIRRTDYPQGLPTGHAVITTAGNLPARYVIHTVGPVYGQQSGRDEELLAQCYQNSLVLARKHSLSSIAFPAISTGIFGYPRAEAASVASGIVKKILTDDDFIKEVRFVLFNDDDARVFLENQKFE